MTKKIFAMPSAASVVHQEDVRARQESRQSRLAQQEASRTDLLRATEARIAAQREESAQQEDARRLRRDASSPRVRPARDIELPRNQVLVFYSVPHEWRKKLPNFAVDASAKLREAFKRPVQVVVNPGDEETDGETEYIRPSEALNNIVAISKNGLHENPLVSLAIYWRVILVRKASGKPKACVAIVFVDSKGHLYDEFCSGVDELDQDAMRDLMRNLPAPERKHTKARMNELRSMAINVDSCYREIAKCIEPSVQKATYKIVR